MHRKGLTIKKIASEMPVPHISLTPLDIEVLYQYKVQDTFRALSATLRSKQGQRSNQGHPNQCPYQAAGKICPACISETVRCRKLVLGRDIG